MAHWIDTHIEEIAKLQRKYDNSHEEMRKERIDILSDMLIYIGKLAAEFHDEYKDAYNARKYAYAQAEFEAPKRPQAYAELAVKEHRAREKEAYKHMKRWDNAFISTREKINALKYHVKIDIEDGSSRQR